MSADSDKNIVLLRSIGCCARASRIYARSSGGCQARKSGRADI